HVCHLMLVGHKADYRMLAIAVEFSTVGFITPQKAAGKFNTHDLHPQAQPQVWHPVLPRPAGYFYLALYSPLSEPPGYDHPTNSLKSIPMLSLLQVPGVNPLYLDLPVVADSCVIKR